MDLTIKLVKLLDGRWEASAAELPNITYIDGDRVVAREKMEALAHALRSPHLTIHDVNEEHGVVLMLRRDGEEPDGGRRESRVQEEAPSHDEETFLVA
jgi:hypothetical protein